MTTREIAARLQQFLRETRESAVAMVQKHGPLEELDPRADRVQMLLLRPSLEMMVEQLEAQADVEERRLADNLACLDQLRHESEAAATASPPPPGPQDLLAELMASANEALPVLQHLRGLLRQAGMEVRIELGTVDQGLITVRLSGPLAMHTAVRELVAEAGPLAGVLRPPQNN